MSKKILNITYNYKYYSFYLWLTKTYQQNTTVSMIESFNLKYVSILRKHQINLLIIVIQVWKQFENFRQQNT